MENARFFVIENEGEVLIVSPIRELGSFAEDEVRDEWDELLEFILRNNKSQVVLDLSRMTYFGSTMLEMMVVLWKRLSARHGSFVVCSVSDVGREILHIAKFDTIWPILATRAEAIAVVTGTAPSPLKKTH